MSFRETVKAIVKFMRFSKPSKVSARSSLELGPPRSRLVFEKRAKALLLANGSRAK